MTFRATNQTQADGLVEAKRLTNQMVTLATSHRDAMAEGNVSANLILQVQAQFKEAISRWNSIKAIPGIVQYVKDQENDQAYDVVAEFNIMIAAAEVVRDKVEADIPVNAGGFWLIRQYDANHDITTRVFTPAQTVALRADLDSFIATVS